MPDWKAILTRRLAERRINPVDHLSVIEEVSQHLDDRYRSLIARGVSSTDAESSVLEELEGDEALERELRWAERNRPSEAPILGDVIIRRMDPGAPLYEMRSMNDLRDHSFNPRRFNMYLLGVFAGTAVLLAAIGLFGVMAYLVSQRTREIGVRMALGADRSAILWLILGRGLVLSAAGAGIGIGLALGLTRVVQGLLYSVSARDPGTFVAAPVLLVAVALAACYLPARRAVKVDPVIALRAE